MFNDEELHSLKERQFAKCFLTDDSPCFDNWCSLEIDHNVPLFSTTTTRPRAGFGSITFNKSVTSASITCMVRYRSDSAKRVFILALQLSHGSKYRIDRSSKL